MFISNTVKTLTLAILIRKELYAITNIIYNNEIERTLIKTVEVYSANTSAVN